MLGEEAFVAEEPLLQPLGIVEAVDTHHQGAAHGAVLHPLAGFMRGGAAGQLGKFARIDADRAGNQLQAAVAQSGDIIIADRAAQFLAHEIAEAFQPFLRVEAHKVIGKEHLHHFPRLGQGHQQLARRPGDVKEKADAVGHAMPAQIGAQRQHMVILHPDMVFRLDQRQHGLGEALIHTAIAPAKLRSYSARSMR
jgi:hypothetical protein